MRKNRLGPVTIRGAAYPSCSAAAKALGVTLQTVSQARAKGTLEAVGLGLSGNISGDSNRRATVIKGVRYESRHAAAAALGIAPSQLSTFLSVAALLKINIE